MSFDSKDQTTISTLEKSESINQSKLHTYVHTYIHTKREKNEKSKNITIVSYNNDNFSRLTEIARRNKTSASAIISNFVDCFVEYFDEKPPTMDMFLDPDFVQTPQITDAVIEKIIPFLKKQDSQTLESLDVNLFMAHVYARVLASLNPEDRKTLTTDYGYVWKTFYQTMRHR